MSRKKTKSKAMFAKKSKSSRNKTSLFNRWRRAPKFLRAASFIAVFAAAGATYLFFAHAAAPDPTWNFSQPDPNYSSDTILLKFKDNVPQAVQDKLLARFSAKSKKNIPQLGVKAITVPPEALDAVEQALSHNPAVQFAEKDFIAVAKDTTPNDPCYPIFAEPTYCRNGSIGFPKMQLPKAWDTTTGSAGVAIAIVDSGVAAHPDLVANLGPGYNVLDGSTNANDTLGHGTEVAGAAAEVGNNAVGSVGYCFTCKIMPIKATNSGTFYMSDGAAGMMWAVDHGAKVLNLSFGGTSSSSTMTSAVNYARQHGVVVVASAGNSANSTPSYPAATPGVIGVAASYYDDGDTLAGYSNYGSWVKISATYQPLVSSLTDPSTGAQWGYVPFGGTSATAPEVSGIVGLLRSAKPTATIDQIEQALLNNTDACCGGKIGGGRVNAYKAMLALTGGTTTPPTDTMAPSVNITAPASGAAVSGQISIIVNASDNVSVSKVELLRNGALVGSTSSSPYSFYWDTSTLANGSYIFSAKAYDTAGNVGISSSITVTVNNSAVSVDHTAPTVSISAPANGTTIGNSVTISASANDNVAVTSMEVYVDGVLRGSSTSGSITINKLNTRKLAKGAHTITVKAYDAAANVGQSAVSVNK